MNLALYPTDWADDNFSVDRETGGTVKLIDLENIVRLSSRIDLILKWLYISQVVVNLTKSQNLGVHRSDNFGCATEGIKAESFL